MQAPLLLTGDTSVARPCEWPALCVQALLEADVAVWTLVLAFAAMSLTCDFAGFGGLVLWF